jgi:phospholipid/cholesterol/gamma-HCH transport system permease protein
MLLLYPFVMGIYIMFLGILGGWMAGVYGGYILVTVINGTRLDLFEQHMLYAHKTNFAMLLTTIPSFMATI